MADRYYFVIVKIGGQKPLIERLQKAAPEILLALTKVSNGNMEQAFRSTDGSTFGYLVKTGAFAQTILQALHTSPTDSYTSNIGESPLQGDDAAFVLELGEDIKGDNLFNRAKTWLQRH